MSGRPWAPPEVADQAAPQRVRLCVVVQYPIHNHLPLYRALAAEPDIDLRVFFMQNAWSESGYDPAVGAVVDWGLPLRDGYDAEVFRNWSPWRDGGERFWKYINPALVWRVVTGSYDAVYVHGHNHLTHVAAIVAARLSGKRLVIRAISYNQGQRSWLKRMLRFGLYRLLYRLADRLLCIGTLNRRFFEEFGARGEQLVYAPHIVDNARLQAESRRLAPRRGALRSSFGIPPNRRVVLFCAKLIPKKRPLAMIDAFFDADLRDWVLLMVGDGPLQAACEARVTARGGWNAVVFTGFLDQRAVCGAFATADMMVLPSSHQETWGLVVNEAMNFGCPVIVSDRVGCAPDLVAAGAGLVFPHEQPDALVDALRRMAGDDALRARCGERARRLIDDWSVKRYVAGLRVALGLRDGAGP